MDVLRILILLAVIFLEEGELAAAMVTAGSFLQIDEASTSIKPSPPLLLPPPPLHGCCEGHMVLLSFHPSHGGSLVCNSGIDIGDLDPNDELHVSAPPVWVLLLAEMEVFVRPLFRISNHQRSTASAGRRAVRSRRQRLGSGQPGSGFGHLFTGSFVCELPSAVAIGAPCSGGGQLTRCGARLLCGAPRSLMLADLQRHFVANGDPSIR